MIKRSNHLDRSLTRRVTRWHRRGTGRLRRPGYLLLETVLGTGLLIVGLAVLGAQVQESDSAVRKMDLKVRALLLAELQLAYMDTGLFEVDSLGEVEEEDFGPRYPQFAWRLTTEETVTESLYRLRLDILYDFQRQDDFSEFKYDDAEMLTTFYLLRAQPKPIDFAEDFGYTEEEIESLSQRLAATGVEGLDVNDFDPTLLAKLELEELIDVLPVLIEAFGLDLNSFLSGLPPEIQQVLMAGQGAEDGGK